jgi:hypothetical protein
MAQQSGWDTLKSAWKTIRNPDKVFAGEVGDQPVKKSDPGGDEAAQKYMDAQRKDMAAARAKRAADAAKAAQGGKRLASSSSSPRLAPAKTATKKKPQKTVVKR